MHREGAPLDRIAHSGERTTIGAFRCAVSDRRFSDSGPIERDIFVFPRCAVRIRHAGGPSFVADPALATAYNKGQIYDRRVVSEEGDRSDWFAVPRAAAMEAVERHGLTPSPSGPFPFPHAPVSDATYLSQRRLFRAAMLGAPALEIEEGVYALLDGVVEAAARARGSRIPPHAHARDHDIAESVRALVASGFEEKWTLARLSATLGPSPFALCRAFRKVMRTSIHQFQTTLRLRVSLERLEDAKGDLAGLAHDLGFAGHSHFSMAFSRRFGAPPSQARETLARF